MAVVDVDLAEAGELMVETDDLADTLDLAAVVAVTFEEAGTAVNVELDDFEFSAVTDLVEVTVEADEIDETDAVVLEIEIAALGEDLDDANFASIVTDLNEAERVLAGTTLEEVEMVPDLTVVPAEIATDF
jgi:hypothetical protein